MRDRYYSVLLILICKYQQILFAIYKPVKCMRRNMYTRTAIKLEINNSAFNSNSLRFKRVPKYPSRAE